MRDASWAEPLLSLFTTRERAESIAGDLFEERDGRGSAWFWFHVFRTTFSLFTSALGSAPAAALALAASGFAQWLALAFAGSAAVFVFPSLDEGVSLLLLSVFWWSAALWTGHSLVGMAPKNGMTACLILAIVVEALLLASRLFLEWQLAPNASSVFVYASALFAVVPLLAGGALARRRTAT